MIRSVGAQCGLLMFGLAIAVGLFAGNSPMTILWRAIAAMLVAALVGHIAGWAAHAVLRDRAEQTRANMERNFHASQQAAAEKTQPATETIETAEAVS